MSSWMKKISMALFAVLATLMLCSCARTIVVEEVLQLNKDSKIYTAYTIWYENPEDISALNIQKGAIIPIGTEVNIVSADEDSLTFTDQNNMEYTINFDAAMMMIPMQEFIKRTFTLTPVDELLKEVKPEVAENIRKGVVALGMNSNEVLLTCGFPAASRTPSLKNSTWIYYIDQDKTLRVLFRGNRVRSVINFGE